MKSNECRAARALLGITQLQLAESANIGLSSVVDFERQRREVALPIATYLQRALERQGVEFIKTSVGSGVRLQSAVGSHAFGIDGRQLKAARALLNWNQHKLADASGLAFETVRRVEKGGNRTYVTTLEQIVNTLRSHRVELISGAGVMLTK